MTDFELTSLGTASALPTIDKLPSAHVLKIRGRLFLIDCGEGCQMSLKKRGISLLKIDNIFISHLHGDHLFGLFGILSSMGMMGRTAPLHLYAPEGLSQIIEFYQKQFGEGNKYEIVHIALNCSKPTLIYSARTIEVSAFPLNHRIATFGFLFKEKTSKLDSDLRSFAYCSDTAPFEELSEWIKGVDLLYHESTFAEDLKPMAEKTFHSTASDAARCALKCGAKRLLLGHFSSRYPDISIFLEQAREIFPETYLAKENLTVNIMNTKNVDQAIFAGGCFWGVEHLMKQQKGVIKVESGYIGGTVENPTYQQVKAQKTGHAEAVLVTFNPSIVSYKVLTKLFFEIHDPTQEGGQGPDIGNQYRSEIFYNSPQQKEVAEYLIEMLKAKGYNVVTKVTPASTFYKAEEYHQNHYENEGTEPYCHFKTKRF